MADNAQADSEWVPSPQEEPLAAADNMEATVDPAESFPLDDDATSSTANFASTEVAVAEKGAEARKRRKAIITSQRQTGNLLDTDEPNANDAADSLLPPPPPLDDDATVETAAALAAADMDEETNPTSDAANATATAVPPLHNAKPAAAAAAPAPTAPVAKTGKRKAANSKVNHQLKDDDEENDDIDDSMHDDEADEAQQAATGSSGGAAAAAAAAAAANAASGKKAQIRYDPAIPMDKEQLAAWRREARRVRNRESAAASRQRIRGRISELEDEVNDWKQKYHNALAQLQGMQNNQNASESGNGAAAGAAAPPHEEEEMEA